jgi:hypothetical protein
MANDYFSHVHALARAAGRAALSENGSLARPGDTPTFGHSVLPESKKDELSD